MALNIRNTDELSALCAYMKYKLQNKYFAIDELKTLLRKNSTNIDAAQYLIKCYLEENKYLEAGNVLKQIKYNVPGAENDPRIQQFGFLNVIFK